MTDQAMAALRMANEIRTRRSRLKREMHAGRIHPAAIVANPPAIVLSMRLGELLEAAPNIGFQKTDKLMRRLEISPLTEIGALSPARRSAIVEFIRTNYPRMEHYVYVDDRGFTAQLRELSNRDRVRIVETLREQHPRLFEAWGNPNADKEAYA